MLTTSGNLNKQIIRLAWPVFLQNLARSLAIAILDSYWIGKISSEHLAAIAVGTFLSWGAYALGELVPIGTNALVSQAVGAKESDSARHIGTLNLFNSVILGIIIAIILIPLLPVLYSFTNLDMAKSALANDYLYPILFLLPCTILFETGSAVFRGHGNTQTPFRLLLLVFSLKALLSPLLIFTFNLGMSGASISTMVSYGSVFIIELILLKKAGHITSLKKKLSSIIKDTKYNLKVTRETFKIGLPLSLEGLAFSFIYVFVSRFVADFGTTGLAALGIGHRSEAIPYQVGEAFAMTASIIVGQNIGARNVERAEKGAWRVLFLSWIPMAVYGFFLFLFPAEIAGIFTTDRAVIETAKVYNLIAAFSIFFAMSEQIFTGAFAGAGNSLPPLVIYLPLTAIRIPLCALLAPIYGMNGVWIAIFSTSIAKGILIAVWFKIGRWKKRTFKLAKQTEAYIESPVEKFDIR
ncbi:MAG: MATE family efflux transporter [Chlorobi bacterium]|nr:MATE family efflux transporter [Chlorobiota bacterium]MCI0715590.1 MATE family efflux transporter [Chlorobiota bacterium]